MSELAREFGINRANLYRSMKRWGLNKPEIEPTSATPEIAALGLPNAQEMPTGEQWAKGEVGQVFTLDWVWGENVGDVGPKRR